MQGKVGPIALPLADWWLGASVSLHLTQEGGTGTCPCLAPPVCKEAPAACHRPSWVFSSLPSGCPCSFGTVQAPEALADAPVPASESLSRANSCSSRETTLKWFIFLNVCAADPVDVITLGKNHKIDKQESFPFYFFLSFGTLCFVLSLLFDIKSIF